MDTEHVAIIDLGTNTFHLLITEINERDDFIVKEKYKEPVKLGEGGITKGFIGKKAFRRGITALKKFRKLINSKGATKIFAFATSAIRSASNGSAFVRQAKIDADIDIKVINGNEEASLIYEGVKNGVQLPWHEYSLLIDIGGGSVEFIVAYENKPLLLRSINIGAARLLEAVKPSDPLSKEDIENTRNLIREKMSPLLEELKEFDLNLLTGSSGTFETLGSLIAIERNDRLSSENLNSYRFTSTNFRKVHNQLLKMSRKERIKMRGMDPMRVDMITMGSLIVELLIKELEIKNIMVSSYALKEGIFYRYIDEKRQRLNHLIGHADRNLRAKAIMNLGKKFKIEREHGLKVSEIALSLFHQLKPLHTFGDGEAELLKYAGLLHDIGYFLNRSGHHKHGQYIIMNAGLTGFSSDELLIIGNIVRYHRKSLPTRDHFHYKVLRMEHRTMVRLLAGILRIADLLDRGHAQVVEEVKTHLWPEEVHISVRARENADIEIQSALEQKKLLETVIKKPITIGYVDEE